MTNKDYQSSMWTNGSYTIEWVNPWQIMVSKHYLGIHIESRLFYIKDFQDILYLVIKAGNILI